MWTEAVLATVFFGGASLGFPSLGNPNRPLNAVQKRDFSDQLGIYQGPSPSDSRGPCPALNTLANHGLLPRNGRDINSQRILDAFSQGWGISNDGVITALENFETVCAYTTGRSCASSAGDGTFTLVNLTLLGETHAFEHDHSFSRQDYLEAYAGGVPTDNIYFNSTEFQQSLDVIPYHPSNPPNVALGTFQDFNQIRLQRESMKRTEDISGTFIENIPTQLTEVGFIFGATYDRDTNGQMVTDPDKPMVRLDWWNFWFSEESFPTELGWVPAPTEIFNNDFIVSVSSAVLAQPITSTPTNLPSDATNPSQPPNSQLPAQDPSPVLPLFNSYPYSAPTNPAHISTEAGISPTQTPTVQPNTVMTITPFPPTSTAHMAHKKRSATTTAPKKSQTVAAAPAAVTRAAIRQVGPAPRAFNLYNQKIDLAALKGQISAIESYKGAVASAILKMS